MRKFTASVLVLVLCSMLAFATSAWADHEPVPDGEGITYKSTLYFSGGRECTLVVELPYLIYYDPWQQWSVRSKAYANCKVKSGSIYLPYDAERIDLWATLRKPYGRSGFLIMDDAESHVYDKSLTSAGTSYVCLVTTSGNYYTNANVYFKLYNDPNQYSLSITTPYSFLGCS